MSGPRGMEDAHYNIDMMDSEILMPDMVDILYHHMAPAGMKAEPFMETEHGPYLQIIEEPKQRGFRFRYKCEGPSHGGLPGASSEKNKKTYPTVKVYNHVGHARVEVQLVTHTDPPRLHAHSLVGKNCDDRGVCSVIVGPKDLTAQFNSLGILHVTKKCAVEVLTERLRQERMRQKQGRSHLTDVEEKAILKEARELGNSMDLNVVRLKFTAFLQDSQGGYTRALKPVISGPIYDSKAPNASNLRISRMDKTCGSVLGGDEVFLLCDKVQKDDIEIRFYEEDEDESWEAFGDFSPTDVHKQYAIVFKTPRYHSLEIDRPVTVFLQLRRKTGGDCSEPKQFTYVPHVQDKEEVLRKRQKPLPHMYDHWPGPQGGAGGQGRGAGGYGGAGGGGGVGGGDSGFQYNPQMDGGNYFGQWGSGSEGGGAQMSTLSPPPGTPANQQQAHSVLGQQHLLRIVSLLQSRSSQVARQTARALLDYCHTGDVRVLLAVQRRLCAVQDENGDTPLHLAIIHQQPGVVEQLVSVIVRIPQQRILDIRNHLRQTPLYLAVITRQPKVVDYLLRAGADPTLLDHNGRSVVHLAAALGDEVMLRVLLTHLGERHAHLFNTADYSGLFPVHLAVRKGGARCLRMLVEGGAKVNAADLKSGSTALHLAVKENLFTVACVLLNELKADVNARTFGGNTPLHLAACEGSPTLCSMLIAAGAQRHLENDEPLFLSSSSSSEGEDEEEEGETDRQLPAKRRPHGRVPTRSSKRPARGHTPFDLCKSQKVKDMLDYRQSPAPNAGLAHSPKKQEEGAPQVDGETLGKLCELMQRGDVPWRQLAEKLGMATLTHLYQECPSPCQSLLENYQLGGGQVEALVEALQSLGLNEGVRLLRQTELRDKIQPTDATVDSGFGSQSLEELREGEAEQPAES
ncbi:nuclear factor NF-kappa-B p100 subunit-like isoform X1 [Megalops cyprinoides]|uniref:nuclear factor NF-kappa-B p100 subunit-like isoform X1 n=2 Tax=Megalops cyprinoides TaxID=118141 RepID=UPI001863A482|nr:nuclear factor NF-kappa-B p100 subunit-like isoform X1 [Megalops cyprinoides]